MQHIEYVITDPIGLHARPAGLLVKEAKKYKSKITLSANGKTAGAERLMAVMGMCVKNGMTVSFDIQGEDEEECREGLIKFLKENL